MQPADALSELAREVRRDTLQILNAADPGWLTWTPPHTTNHILWHARHALWLQDLMCVEPLSGKSDLPVGWTDQFGMNSLPSGSSDWPTRAEVVQLLEAQLRRIVELLRNVTPDRLSRPAPGLSSRRGQAGWIIHGLHDEAKHSGEMYLLWKMCRFGLVG